MPSLTELVDAHTDLDADDVEWLQLLMADWQILADLSFADLVLWLPDRAGRGWWAAGQMRPTTGPTALVDDVLGTFVPVGRRRMLDEAFTHGRLVREGDPEWRDHVPVRVEVIPVRRTDRVIACELCYRFADPARGQIVIFEAPEAAAEKCGAAGTAAAARPLR